MQTLQRPRWLSRPFWVPRPRLGARHVVCQASKTARPSQPPEPQQSRESQLAAVVKALEHVSIACALVSHVQAISPQQHALPQLRRVVERVVGPQRATVLQQPPPQQPYVPSGAQAPGSLWLTLPLLLAFLLHKLHGALTSRRRPPAARVADEAAARLVRLESLSSQQQQGLDIMGKQLEKLAARVRIVGRDLGEPLREAQEGVAAQAGVLVGVTQRLQQVERDVRDAEQLVEAMQGVSAKQFDLLLKVIKQQQEQQQALQQRGGGPPPPPPAAKQQQQQQQKEKQPLKPPTKPSPAASTKPPQSGPTAQPQRPQAVAAAAPAVKPPPPPAATAPSSNGSGAPVDEWGRKVVQAPHSAAPEQQPQLQQPPAAAAVPKAPSAAAEEKAEPVAPQPLASGSGSVQQPGAAAGAAGGGAGDAGEKEGRLSELAALRESSGLDSSDESDLALVGLSSAHPAGSSVSNRLLRAVSSSGSGWVRRGEGADAGTESFESLGPVVGRAPPPPPAAAGNGAGGSGSGGAGEEGSGAAKEGSPTQGGLSKAIHEILNQDPFFLTEQQMLAALTKRQRLPPLPSSGGDSGDVPESGGSSGGPGGSGTDRRPPGSPGGSGSGGPAGGEALSEEFDVVEELLRQLRAGTFEQGGGGQAMGQVLQELEQELGGGGEEEEEGRRRSSGEGAQGLAAGFFEDQAQQQGQQAQQGQQGQQAQQGQQQGQQRRAPSPSGARIIVRHSAPAAAEGSGAAAGEEPTSSLEVDFEGLDSSQAAQAAHRLIVHHGGAVTVEEHNDGTVTFTFDEGAEQGSGSSLGGQAQRS